MYGPRRETPEIDLPAPKRVRTGEPIALIEESDDDYSPPEGPTEEIELFPGMSIGIGGGSSSVVPARPVAAQNPPQQTQVEPSSSTNDPENSEPVSIQGTNIVLDSEEDVKKWIEERRKNWPTRKRIVERQQQKKEESAALAKIGVQAVTKGRICKFYARTGKCKNGAKCAFLHEKRDKSQFKRLPNHKLKVIHGVPMQIPQRFTPMTNQGKSLSSLLVESEQLRDENLQLLDLFGKLVKSGAVSTDWEALKRKLGF